MTHFGQGGLVDYILGEISWIRPFGRNTVCGQFIGKHEKGEDGYEYEAPFYWWDLQKIKFSHAIHYDGLKTNRQELRV